jgi:hypothetical protein
MIGRFQGQQRGSVICSRLQSHGLEYFKIPAHLAGAFEQPLVFDLKSGPIFSAEALTTA